MRWAGHAARMVEMRHAHIIMVREPVRTRQRERTERRWKDIRMDLREIWW